jgi:flagellar basal body-associated protein FliL
MNGNNFTKWVILVIFIVVLLLAISLAFDWVKEKPKSKIPPNPVLISSKARIGSYIKVWWSLEPYAGGWVNVTHRDLICYPAIDFEIYNSGGDGNVVVHVRIDYWSYNASKHDTFFVKSNSTLTGSIEFKEIWTSPYESPDAIKYWIKVEPES